MISLQLYKRTKKGYQLLKFRSRKKAMAHVQAVAVQLAATWDEIDLIQVNAQLKQDTCQCTAKNKILGPYLEQMLKGSKVTSNITPHRNIQYRVPIKRSILHPDSLQDQIYPFTAWLC